MKEEYRKCGEYISCLLPSPLKWRCLSKCGFFYSTIFYSISIWFAIFTYMKEAIRVLFIRSRRRHSGARPSIDVGIDGCQSMDATDIRAVCWLQVVMLINVYGSLKCFQCSMWRMNRTIILCQLNNRKECVSFPHSIANSNQNSFANFQRQRTAHSSIRILR